MGCGCKGGNNVQKSVKQVTKNLPQTTKIGPSIRRTIKRPAK